MTSHKQQCPICAGPPYTSLVVFLKDLMPAEYRAWKAWYLQPCGQCGKAIGVHQKYRHPHRGIGKGWQCGGCVVTQQEGAP